MEHKLKFFSKKLLKEANEAAHREKRNYCINPKFIDELENDNLFFISKFLYHKKNELRLFVHLDAKKPNSFKLIDVSVTRYLSLPFLEENEYGEFEIIIPKRPFPNSREWKETEIKQPLRKQSQFRKNILSAYNYTCAVCEINEPRLLKASHILDVQYGGEDIISNGLCLCSNHEIAFDSGVLKILPDFRIYSEFQIGLTVNVLKLPENKDFNPNPEFIKKKNELNELKNNYI